MARYTLPGIKTTLSADANIYSRRGYGNKTLNTDDFVMNASVSQPFLKGKLIATWRSGAFALLGEGAISLRTGRDTGHCVSPLTMIIFAKRL